MLVRSNFGKDMRIHFERLVNWHVRLEFILVYIQDNIFDFYLNREVKSTENNTANKCQKSGNENGRFEVPREDVEMRCEEGEEPLEAEIPPCADGLQESHHSRETKHEDAGDVVYRSWCSACVEGRKIG